MDNLIKITVDGQEIAARPGQTILDVIQQNRIAEIPTLCHDPKLPPYGSCYLCVVEVKGVAKLIPSCSSPVAPGMVVQTDNDRIRRARKTALELLLSNHYADCLAPCTQTCPAGVDVQGYIALVANGRFHEAIRLIKETNPLPLVCGRVCVRECEIACRRNRVDSNVGIDYLKRYAADLDIADPWTPELPAPNGKRVAVIGGGPGGLSCAYYLRLRGYAVTLFEQMPKLGGMLRYGIPEYRLPKKVLDREIKWITDLGVTVKVKQTLGGEIKLDELLAKGFHAVFLAPGAWKAKGMRLPDEDTTRGVLKGADFLRSVQSKPLPELHGHVVVVGGGNTAIDAARTARRLGAGKVTLLYRRTRAEMPAHPAEIEAALEEGVSLTPLSAPTRIVSRDGQLAAIECIRMELGEPDASGRRSPVPQAGSEYVLDCDHVISAIGQDVDLKAINADNRLSVSRHSAIAADKHTFQTSDPRVFAGGDAITGPATAIEAIAHGHFAADAIDRFLATGKAAGPAPEFLSKRDSFGELPDSDFDEIPRLPKQRMPEMPPAKRVKGFKEVELGFSPEQAESESARCMECGCSAYFDCDLRRHASDFNIDVSRFLGEVRRYRVDRRHPFITLDANKCIACGRCVRTCSEVLQVSALGFVYRGFKAIVKPAMEKKLQETTCINCGNCIDACPTGSISEALPFCKPGPWKAELRPSFCTGCSLNCRMNIKIFHPGQFTVSGAGLESHNQGYLCDRGHFGYRYMLEKRRLLVPRVKQEGTQRDTSWDVALKTAADRLEAIRRTHGRDSIAVFASPAAANEELQLLKTWAGSPANLASFSLLGSPDWRALDSLLGATESSLTLEQLAEADVILAVNTNFEDTNFIAELRIKAAQKRGARVVTISSSESPLSLVSDLWLDAKRGTSAVLLGGLARQLLQAGRADSEFIRQHVDGLEEFQRSISGLGPDTVAEISGVSRDKLQMFFDLVATPETKLAVVYQTGGGIDKSPQDLEAIANLLLLTGSFNRTGAGLLLTHPHGNTQGLLDLGYGRDSAALCKRMADGEIKAAIVFGEDPLTSPANLRMFNQLEFLLVADAALTHTAEAADVVLPTSNPSESAATYTACDRRVQRLNRVFASPTGRENWQFLAHLAQPGAGAPIESAEVVFDQIRAQHPGYQELSGDGQFRASPLAAGQFATVGKRARFQPLALSRSPIWLPQARYLDSENFFLRAIRGKLMV